MYEPSRHVNSFYVAGFQYYDGASVLDLMKVGSPVSVALELDNPHDPDAMLISFKGTKIGYVPKDEVRVMPVLCFYGHGDALEAKIIQVDPREAPWKQVRVGVYVRDGRKGSMR